LNPLSCAMFLPQAFDRHIEERSVTFNVDCTRHHVCSRVVFPLLLCNMMYRKRRHDLFCCGFPCDDIITSLKLLADAHGGDISHLARKSDGAQCLHGKVRNKVTECNQTGFRRQDLKPQLERLLARNLKRSVSHTLTPFLICCPPKTMTSD
jgi:hypothetical protein